MPYSVRNQRPSPLHIPDADLRLEPGETVTVGGALAAVGPTVDARARGDHLVVPDPAASPRTAGGSPRAVALRSATCSAARAAVPHWAIATRQRSCPRVCWLGCNGVITGYVTIPPPVTAGRCPAAAGDRAPAPGGDPARDRCGITDESPGRSVDCGARWRRAEAPSAPAHPLPAPLLAQGTAVCDGPPVCAPP